MKSNKCLSKVNTKYNIKDINFIDYLLTSKVNFKIIVLNMFVLFLVRYKQLKYCKQLTI